MRVFVVTPPDPVVTLEEAKRHLKIEAEDNDEDALVAAFVAAATGHIDGPDGWLGRALGVQILEARTDVRCGHQVCLPFPPVIELVSISYLDFAGTEQMADLADLEVLGRDLVASGHSWPWEGGSLRRESVRIRYRAGYETLPPAIKAAILLMVSDLYRNRDSVAFTVATAIPMSTTVEALLAPFRIYT